MKISKLFLAMLLATGVAAAQQAITVAVDGITGQSQLPGFTGQCEALSWSFGATDPASSTTPGTATGKTQISALVLARPLDSCSPNLLRYATIGQRINTVKLTQSEPAGGSTTNKPVMVVTLSDAVVSSYQIGGTESKMALESVSFVFTKITFEYFVYDNNTGRVQTIQVSYDVSKGY